MVYVSVLSVCMSVTVQLQFLKTGSKLSAGTDTCYIGTMQQLKANSLGFCFLNFFIMTLTSYVVKYQLYYLIYVILPASDMIPSVCMCEKWCAILMSPKLAHF